jgi:exosortase/archaeosortase family protein
MSRSRALVWLRVAFIVLATPAAFVLLESHARTTELGFDIGTLRLFGVHRVPVVIGTTALILPLHSTPFFVDLTASCSSLASVLTLLCIALALPSRIAPLPRRLLAFSLAAVAVIIGNLLRIDLSILVGVLISRSSLVLFHDWAGSIFGFAYTMGGFILMLWVLLPKVVEGEKTGIAGVLPALGRPSPRPELGSGMQPAGSP